MKQCRLTPLEATFVALWTVIKSPIIKRLIISKALNNYIDKATVNIKTNYKHSFVSIRLLQSQSREQSMPPEWIGYKTAERIIVYHEADKAGPHIESYITIGNTSYNIGVKRLTKEMFANVKKNSDRTLTNKTKEYLIGILINEYKNGAWLAQTTDHTPDEAKSNWLSRGSSPTKGYGNGESRHILSTDRIALFKTGTKIEYYDPVLSEGISSRISYIFSIIGDDKKGRILKLGFKKPDHKEFKDRLHLKPHIGNESFEKFRERTGEDGIVTIKEDGASCYFEITKKGMNIFSPRISKKTGDRIVYNNKVKDIIHLKSNKNISGMGELVFQKNGKTLNAHEIGGLLNSHSVIDDNIEPRITIYRLDRIGRENIHNISYKENLTLIRRLVDSLNNKRIVAPTTVEWKDAQAIANNCEGLVGIPKDASILDGLKFKPRHDTFDWTVIDVDLKSGDKGGIAGVVWFKSESNKIFKIGASSMGNREEATDIMNNPDKYIGRVAKISSYKGHEGRAPRFVDWHEGKGAY